MAPVLVKTYSEDGTLLRLEINRPQAKNALDETLIKDLTQDIVSAARDPNLRAVILTGSGDAFCAGTDIEWMEALALGNSDNDTRRLANLLYQIWSCPVPVIARINGIAFGAGVGLAAAADIAVASEDALFSLPAVRLGVVPAVIGPFVTEAIGIRHARRYALTGETFSAMEARRIGLVHAVCVDAHLDATIAEIIDGIKCGAPGAIRETKCAINQFGESPPSQHLLNEAAKFSARIRKGDEAAEGLRAFTENRLPAWQDDKK